ncbi:MAG: COX15/CtaA family protein [Sphingobacteriales bacterium]|nr:MAG: COX15/CtaA family protein [Sphingobacteriales bacterium]
MTDKNKRQLGFFLIAALVIIFFQVIIGGVTRLTGSGLSITEWKPVTGTFPPLTAESWQSEFDKYRETPQYHKLNKGMTLSEFKFIYFWEWLHRLWGRIGFLFILAIFAVMLYRKQLDRPAIRHFLVFLFLYLCQGLLGWIMVKSGLVDMPWVSHYRLTAHLLLAVALFSYVLWFISDLLIPEDQRPVNSSLKKFTFLLITLLILQVSYGGFMSGLRAAMYYPSFPDMNGQFVPDTIFSMNPFLLNFTENIATIQFVHRSLAYLLFILIMIFWWKARKISTGQSVFITTVNFLPVLLFIQFALGITVLLLSKYGIPVGFGVAHQAVGLLLLSTVLLVSFQLKKTNGHQSG